MKRILPLILGTALALTACTGNDGASTPRASTSATPSASSIALADAFCDDAAQLYQRDVAMAQATADFDPTTMSATELADPDVLASYLDAIDIDGWQSWRALYLQAAEDSGSPQMQEWIETIVAATDLQFEAYAQAAETTDNLTDWSTAVTEILVDRQDEVEITGNEALSASEASLTSCEVPLSVPAGELLGYAP